VTRRSDSRLRGIDLAGIEGLAELVRPHPFASLSPERIPEVLADVLGVPDLSVTPPVTEGETWTRDGVDGIHLRWNVGFGADTEAWLLRPSGERAPLPGALALHCHSDVKYYGKEKIADGPADVPHAVRALRAQSYGDRAWANELARSGVAVLAHDVFGWGSRRASVDAMPRRSERYARFALATAAAQARDGAEGMREDAVYEIHAAPHEDAMAKTLGLLGTSWGGVVVREDLLAINVLTARPDVAAGGVTVVGMSGGGARAALTSALSDDVVATGIMSMMSTFDAMMNGYVHEHTWMMLNPHIGRVGEWPDVAAARAPRPLFVGYAADDELFPAEGMRAADARLRDRYRRSGSESAYRAWWVDARHSFGAEMQDAFIAWHRELLAAR
jgi:dienelactone hydrolase